MRAARERVTALQYASGELSVPPLQRFAPDRDAGPRLRPPTVILIKPLRAVLRPSEQLRRV